MPRKIMVVDDDEGVRALLAAAFGGAGYTVFPVGAAEEALGLVTRENIQVAFIDLQLPGMSGLELCRKIRKDRAVDILFALTGYASVFDLVECREAGFDDYFTKPFDPAALVKIAHDAFVRLDRWKDLLKAQPRRQ
jgi:CheY-like chemotaxis protein